MTEMDFNRKEYINKIVPCIQNFWSQFSQTICSSRKIRKCPFNVACDYPSHSGNNLSNYLCQSVNEHLDSICKKVLGNRTPSGEFVYAHNFYLTINGNDGLFKRILLETWQLSWEEKPYSSKYDNFQDQIENLLKVATLTSMSLPMHELTLENLETPFNCSFYTYHYCLNGAALGCALPGGCKKVTILVGQARTKVSQLSLYMSYVQEIDLNMFADEVKAMEIAPSPERFNRSRGESGSSPELQFTPDDILQLEKTSGDSLPEKPTNLQTGVSDKGGEKSARGSMLDVTCAFADGEDPMSEDLKQNILDCHRLSRLEDELIKSFHKTLSLEKLVEAKKAAEQGMILNEKIGEVLDSSAIMESKSKVNKSVSKIGRQSSLPSKSPFTAVPLVKIPDQPHSPRQVAESTISEVSKQLLDINAAAGRLDSSSRIFDPMAPFGDDKAEDLASLYTMFKNAPDINFRATNELQNLDEKFKYFEEMKVKGEELYEKIKRQRRELEESDRKE